MVLSVAHVAHSLNDIVSLASLGRALCIELDCAGRNERKDRSIEPGREMSVGQGGGRSVSYR